MLRILVVAAVTALLAAEPAFAQKWVEGHVRRDGTYVPGHYTKPSPYAPTPSYKPPRLVPQKPPRIRSPGRDTAQQFIVPTRRPRTPKASDPTRPPKTPKYW